MSIPHRHVSIKSIESNIETTKALKINLDKGVNGRTDRRPVNVMLFFGRSWQ